mmetsp:Transcript_11584/g.49425  ORF Transcript_11584/g.49425 Transcript_11584/m.49425 type:complete len:233 (-) Transcript_11584:2976-3674(-)
MLLLLSRPAGNARRPRRRRRWRTSTTTRRENARWRIWRRRACTRSTEPPRDSRRLRTPTPTRTTTTDHVPKMPTTTIPCTIARRLVLKTRVVRSALPRSRASCRRSRLRSDGATGSGRSRATENRCSRRQRGGPRRSCASPPRFSAPPRTSRPATAWSQRRAGTPGKARARVPRSRRPPARRTEASPSRRRAAARARAARLASLVQSTSMFRRLALPATSRLRSTTKALTAF